MSYGPPEMAVLGEANPCLMSFDGWALPVLFLRANSTLSRLGACIRLRWSSRCRTVHPLAILQ